MPKSKIEELEYLRGFAFLAVVLQHAIGHYAYGPESTLGDGVLLGVLLLTAKFAVPVFIFITGFVLMYNYKGGVRVAAFARKRFRDIVLPYLPWVLLYGLMEMPDGLLARPGEAALYFGGLAVTGKAMYHLWYVVMTVQLYALFPLLRPVVALADSFVTKRRLGVPALLLLAAGYVWLTGQAGAIGSWADRLAVPVLTDWLSTYGDRNAIFFLYYFVLGAAAGLHADEWKKWLLRREALVYTAYAAFALYMLYVVVNHLQTSPQLIVQYDDTFLVQPLMASFLIVSVLGMYAFAGRFAELAPPLLRGAVLRLAKLSYTAYLAHALMLTAAVWAADRLLPGAPVTLRTVVAALLCAAGSALLAAAIGCIGAFKRTSRDRSRPLPPNRAG